jgi:hypothetical protein
MFPVPLLLFLGADSLAIDLDSWVPRRMALHRVPGLAVTMVARDAPAWTWTHGVENVLTRRAVGPATRWPLGTRVDRSAAVPPEGGLASAHASLAVVLPPGLIILGVLGGIAWVVLVPVSLAARKRWRFGRWHEVVAVLLAAPVAWVYLRRLGGPVLASYFTAMALAGTLLPLLAASLAWTKSRLGALVLLSGAAGLIWSVRALVVPIPAAFGGGGAMDIAALRELSTRALDGDSTAIASLGLQQENGRWVARQNSRGSTALFVIVPDRRVGVVAVANVGGSEELLRTVAEAVLR